MSGPRNNIRWLRAATVLGLACSLVACAETFSEGDLCHATDPTCAPGAGDQDDGLPAAPDDLLAAPCLTLYGAESAEEALGDDYVIFGTIFPKSGGLADFGPDMERAVVLAAEEINQAGGILGTKIAILACDSATSSYTSVAAAEHLTQVAKVPAIIGPAASGNVIEVFTQVAKDADTLVVGPSGTSPAITNMLDNDLLWRTVPSDAIQGGAVAQMILAAGFDRVAVYNRNDAYGAGLRDGVVDVLCADLSSCTEDRYFNVTWDPGDDVYDFDLPGLASFDPQVIVLIAFPDDAGAQLMNAASGQGHQRFILTDGMKADALGAEPEPLVSDPVSLCQTIATAPAGPSGSIYDGFEDRFESAWGHTPGLFTSTAYDALYVIALAAVTARASGAAITGPNLAAGLKRLSGGAEHSPGSNGFIDATAKLAATDGATIDYVGASGALDFDPDTGEAPGPVEAFVYDVDDEAFASVGVVLTADGEFQVPAPAGGLFGETCADIGTPWLWNGD